MCFIKYDCFLKAQKRKHRKESTEKKGQTENDRYDIIQLMYDRRRGRFFRFITDYCGIEAKGDLAS